MAYTAEISRKNPGCFLFLIDQSGSMADLARGATNLTKSQGVADNINKLLQTISIKCSKDDEVRDYFDVGVLYYKGNRDVGQAFGVPLVPIKKVAENPRRVDEVTRKEYLGPGEAVDLKVKLPIWFEPVHEGGTPMCAALKQAHQILEVWVQSHQESFPAILINITDGQATDGDPEPDAESIKQLATQDGNVLVFNCHMSSTVADPVLFPESEGVLPDNFAKLLFRMSSVLPPNLLEEARKSGYEVKEKSRGFVFNASMADLVTFLDIGTRVARDLPQDEDH